MAFITGNHFQMFGEHEYVVLHWNDGWRTWLLVWLYIVFYLIHCWDVFPEKQKYVHDPLQYYINVSNQG